MELGKPLGLTSVLPSSTATLELTEPLDCAPGATQVWRYVARGGEAYPESWSEMWQESKDVLWYHNSSGRRLRVDIGTRCIQMSPGAQLGRLHGVASIALPALEQAAGRLVVHAAAATRDGETMLVCAASGTGKSTLLIEMVAAGWHALTEDVAVLDVGSLPPKLWPGPPWVWLRAGSNPGEGWQRLSRSGHKDAWDLGPWMASAPSEVTRIVMMGTPGGDEVDLAPMSRADLIGAMGRQSIWLGEPSKRAESQFPLVARLASRVPGWRLRLPRDGDWVKLAVTALQGG